MTYGWRSHLAFNDDGRGAAVATSSQEQVLNLTVSATSLEEAGDDQAIELFDSTGKRPGGLRSTLAADAGRPRRHFLFTWYGRFPGSPR